MAILGLVFAFVFWPLGIVFSAIARRQIRETGEDGDALALAGLICSIVFGVLFFIIIAVVVTAVSHIHTNPGFPNGSTGFPTGVSGFPTGPTALPHLHALARAARMG